LTRGVCRYLLCTSGASHYLVVKSLVCASLTRPKCWTATFSLSFLLDLAIIPCKMSSISIGLASEAGPSQKGEFGTLGGIPVWLCCVALCKIFMGVSKAEAWHASLTSSQLWSSWVTTTPSSPTKILLHISTSQACGTSALQRFSPSIGLPGGTGGVVSKEGEDSSLSIAPWNQKECWETWKSLSCGSSKATSAP
jgi:hypothetical protein